MTAFLIDEMLQPVTAELLGRLGHDAIHVGEVGLAATPDDVVAEAARTERRALVTENVADFAHEADLVLVFVLKRSLPSGGAMTEALALVLDRWSRANPVPYVGAHWPTLPPRREPVVHHGRADEPDGDRSA